MKYATSLILLTISSLCFAQTPELPPSFPIQLQSNTYHGIVVVDSYQAMENMAQDKVQKWFKKQDEFAQKILENIPNRDILNQRIQQLENLSEVKTAIPITAGGKIFFSQKPVDQDAERLLYRDSLTSNDVLLLDTQSLNESLSAYHTIDYIVPSPNGKLVAVGISQDGSEQSVIYLIEVNSQKILPERIKRAMYGHPAWLPNSDGFFYLQFQESSERGSDNDYTDSEAMFHRIGTQVADDRVVFSRKMFSDMNLESIDMPFPYIFPGSDHLFVEVNRGPHPYKMVYQISIQKAISDSMLLSQDWEEVVSLQDEVTSFTVQGDQIFLLTNKQTPHAKILMVSLTNSDSTTILPEGDIILEEIQIAQNTLYVQGVESGIGKLVRISLDDYQVQQVVIPFSADINIGDTFTDSQGIFMSLSTWTQPEDIYYYSPSGNGLIRLFRYPEKGMLSNLSVKEVEVSSHDGTMVPLTIIHRQGIAIDGQNPTMLYGYGTYGTSMSPRYTSSQLAWYEQGGIIAIAHVRGGGEKGEAWHKAGMKATKPNSWKDFIACAEYLINERYTSSEKIAALSGSAGGILIGRSITERPNLFQACIISVGVLNTVRFEETPNTLQVVEFGTVQDSLEFQYLYEMDAYHHVEDNTAYPAMLFTAGMNDARVSAWQPGKMVARMQSATNSGQPILLKVAFDGGHYGSSPSKRIEELTNFYSFLLWQLGHPDFQPVNEEPSNVRSGE